MARLLKASLFPLIAVALMHEPCEKCESRRWVWTHHSGDGHGGLLGGAWDHLPCRECGDPVLYPMRADFRQYYPAQAQRFLEQQKRAASEATVTRVRTLERQIASTESKLKELVDTKISLQQALRRANEEVFKNGPALHQKLCWSGPCYSHDGHVWTEDWYGGGAYWCPGAATDRT